MDQQSSLLDYLAFESECEYISDMPTIGMTGKWKLYCAVKKLEPDIYALSQWNEALTYLTRRGPENTSEEARSALLQALIV